MTRVGRHMQEMPAELDAAAYHAADDFEDDGVLELEVHQRGDPGDRLLDAQGCGGAMRRLPGSVAELFRKLAYSPLGLRVDQRMVVERAAYRGCRKAERDGKLLDRYPLGHVSIPACTSG